MTMHDELIELVAEGLWQRSRKGLGLRSEYLPKSRTDLRTEAATALSARSGGWRVALQYIAEYTAQTGGSPRLEHIHSTAIRALTPPETTP